MIEKQRLSKDKESKYGPICLLCTFEELLKVLNKEKINKAMEERNQLMTNRFGFKQDKSTIDALMEELIKRARQADEGNWKSKKFALLVTFDVEKC